MSHNKLEIGSLIRIFYNNKWSHAEIIDMNKDKITIKLWKSPIKSKFYEIERAKDWMELVIKKKVFRNECIYFPSWIKMSQIVCSVSITNYSKTKYYKIADYNDGKNITIFSIDQLPNKKMKELEIIKRKIIPSNKKTMREKLMYTHWNNKCELIPVYHELNDYKLFKKLISIHDNNKNNKTNNNSIIKYNNNKILNLKLNDDDIELYEMGQYIIDQSSECKKILSSIELFPKEVNDLILIYLSKKIIYICPPSKCIKKRLEKRININTIGCEFKLKRNLWIIGFSLYHDEVMQSVENNKICLIQRGSSNKIPYEASLNGIDLNEYNDYLLKEPVELIRNKMYQISFVGKFYFVDKQQKSTINYSWHETQYTVLTYWKIFKSIKWMDYLSGSWRIPLHIFPHFALLLS